MNTIGEKIAELRKSKAMTQEELASCIGVSPQAVSKWENNVNMPDIILLPVIADVFETSVDELFSIRKKPDMEINYDNLPELAYLSVLETFCRTDICGICNPAAVIKEYRDNPNIQTGVISHEIGASVFANKDLAVAYLNPRIESVSLFEDKATTAFLAALSEETFRKILKYFFEKPGTMATAASAASKLNIPETKAEKALERLAEFGFVISSEIEGTDEERLKVYKFLGEAKVSLLLFPMLSLAKRLASTKEGWFGFRG